MLCRPTQEIYDAFQLEGYKCRICKRSDCSYVETAINFEALRVELHYISFDDEGDVSVRVPDYATFPTERTPVVLQKLAEFNASYRGVKFVADTSRGVISLHADMPLSAENTGEIALEMFRILPGVGNAVYPELMGCIWGDDDGEDTQEDI